MTTYDAATLATWEREFTDFWGDVITDPDALRLTFTEVTGYFAALGVTAEELGLPTA